MPIIAFSDDANRGRALTLAAGVSVREDLVQQDILREPTPGPAEQPLPARGAQGHARGAPEARAWPDAIALWWGLEPVVVPGMPPAASRSGAAVAMLAPEDGARSSTNRSGVA